MATISEALAIAIGRHQAGQLQAAEQIYRQILQAQPNHPQAWHLLGVVAHQVGQHEIAVDYIGRAIRLNANEVDFHNNLGAAYRALQKIPEAVACWRRALELKPDCAQAHYNLGNALRDQGGPDEAIACYRRAVELQPDYADAHNNLGVALKIQGKLEEAIACWRRVLELKPNSAETYCNLGNAWHDQRKLEEAVACYRRAMQLKPDYAEVHNNLGNALKDQGKLDEAVACLHRAIDLKPGYAEAHNNLGTALQDQGELQVALACYRRAVALNPDFAQAHYNLGNAFNVLGNPDAAVASYRRALELRPNYAEAYNNLGAALKEQGNLDDAVACCRRALELKADFADAHWNQSLLSLLAGDFQRGWAEYEWRWKAKVCQPRDFSQPLWDGRPLQGKTILLHAEQGLGDAIQFVRYASLVKQRGGTVIVECPGPLSSLVTSCRGIDQVVERGDPLPAFDVHTPILSLPRIFQTNLRDIPATVPYLLADPKLVEPWRRKLGPTAAFQIGIAWRGSPTHGNDRNRSIPLDCFEPLARRPGVRLLSLQKGAAVEELQPVAKRFPIVELGSGLRDFMDTAAVLTNLDLLITCDTAVAHLAGAVGIPVWVALPFVPDWRWLLERSDSPWYPTMRLFRQDRRGDWQGVFRRIEIALDECLASPAVRQGPGKK